MVGNIYGDGQRGGIFGARIDPRLTEELERRAALKREELARPDFEQQSLTARILAAPSRLFGGLVVDPAVEGITDLVTLAGDVKRGAQPTMSMDPQTGEMHTDPRLSERTANAAGTLTLGAGAIPAEANALRMGIKAYHGSPHDFERFSSEKIGTGEGAQAYGHGLYFAENEGVARQYRDLLGTRSSAVDDPVARAQFWASDLGSREAATAHLEGVLRQAERSPKNFDADDLEKTRQAIDYLKSGGDLMPKSGSMYEVDIAAEPEQFLDWDKPLAEQSPQVQQAALGTAQPPDPGALRKRAETATGAEREFLLNQAKYLENQLRFTGEGWHGSAVAENLPSEWDDFEVARRIARTKVAEQLKERGASGIRYLDQGSRTAGEGSRNYVIFPGNEHLISVLKKYGLPISAAGLAALHELHPEEAQAAQR